LEKRSSAVLKFVLNHQFVFQAIKRAADHHGTRPGAGIAGDRAGRPDGGEETWLFGRAFLRQDS
jgi:hypothetical protein